MFRVSIEPSVFTLEPGLKRVVVGVRLPSPWSPAGELEAALREAESQFREQHGMATLASHPHLAAWRRAFRGIGSNPTEYRPSVDALARRVAKGNNLPSIHPLVDLGSILSLRYLIPVGVHPFADGEALALRTAREGDVFEPPVGPREQPAPSEVVFARGSEILTRRWVWRQSLSSMVRPSTPTAEFNLDALPPVALEDLARARGELVNRLARIPHCKFESTLLDARHPEAELAV